jgi:hypothetical protein
VGNLAKCIKASPDHLEVQVLASLTLNVLLPEVGLTLPEIVGVRGRNFIFSEWSLGGWSTNQSAT